jgi:S-adenosylmethionine-diacylglycerol 3-amino-3-carboxypropyl transferase
MSDLGVLGLSHGRGRLRQAVHRHNSLSWEGAKERLFTLAFGGLVYPQIWEDPIVDLEALDLGPDDHLVTIASGGCNVLSYLTVDPARITAVDLNPAHLALTELKLTAVQRLPSYEDFARFFAAADAPGNVELYDLLLAPCLSPNARRYWEGRDLRGRRRIEAFARGLYRHGLLGRFIGLGHLLARLYGVNLEEITEARSLAEQRAFFAERIAPLFDKRPVRLLTGSPLSLYGLGIPPAQYRALAGGRAMIEVLKERLERLATAHPLACNYFAWQAFARRYEREEGASLPPYLERANYRAVRERTARVGLHHRSVTEALAAVPRASIDAVVLLDAQDWMTDRQLGDLWGEMALALKPGARVIFRTAGERSILPGRLPAPLLARWAYEEERSRELHSRDRSAIYGGFHLYSFEG